MSVPKGMRPDPVTRLRFRITALEKEVEEMKKIISRLKSELQMKITIPQLDD